MRNEIACKLIEESAIKGFPSRYSIYSSQLKYQMKKVWLKASVLYMSNYLVVSHMQHFAPYATVCLWSLYAEQSTFGQKLLFFFKFNKFKPLKLFFRDFSLSANLV